MDLLDSVCRDQQDEAVPTLLEICCGLTWFGFHGNALGFPSHVELKCRATDLDRKLDLPDSGGEANRFLMIMMTQTTCSGHVCFNRCEPGQVQTEAGRRDVHLFTCTGLSWSCHAS